MSEGGSRTLSNGEQKEDITQNGDVKLRRNVQLVPAVRRNTGNRILAPQPQSLLRQTDSTNTSAHSLTNSTNSTAYTNPSLLTNSITHSNSLTSISSSSSASSSSSSSSAAASCVPLSSSLQTPHHHAAASSEPTSQGKKRNLTSFQESHADHTSHTERDRGSHFNKRVKGTPSQVVADEMARVRLMASTSRPTTSSSISAHTSFAAAAAAASMDTSTNEEKFVSSSQQSVDSMPVDSSSLLSPADMLSPGASSSAAEEFECEESLEEDTFAASETTAAVHPADANVEMMESSEGPSAAIDKSPAVTSAQAVPASVPESPSLYLPPSSYRSYRPKEPLIVSVETALEDYDSDLEATMWDSEQQFQPYLYYLIYQPHLDQNMRPILVDWMFEVAAEYCLARETAYLAINYVDRFLSASPASLPADGTARSVIDRKSLQLLGATCLWLASKVEEIFPPSPDDFAITTDGAADSRHIMEMEPVVLQVLNWRLHAQTPYSWLKLFLKKSAVLLYQEFVQRAQTLFAQSAPSTPIQPQQQQPHPHPVPTSKPTDESSEPMSSAHTVTPSTPITPSQLTTHQAHQQFSLLQLDFLHQMEFLLSAAWFIRMMEFLDVLCLDMHSLRFYPSQLAASALFIVHPPGSPLHDIIVDATTYTAEQLAPCISLLQLFKDMPFRGPPPPEKRAFLHELKIPYDEFHSRQVHNPEGPGLLHKALDEAGTLDAVTHTNIFRNLPAFLGGDLWAELIARSLVSPIRNSTSHQRRGMWVMDNKARHNDPRTFGFHGILDPLDEMALNMAEASAVAAAHIAPIAPHTDSFLAAASKPYARLPKEVVRAPPQQQAPPKENKREQAVSSTAPVAVNAPALNMHTNSNATVAAAAAAAASSSSATIYTFGAAPAATSTKTSAPMPPAYPATAPSASHSSVAPSTSTSSSTSSNVAARAVVAAQEQDEWLTSDEEEDGADA